MNLRYGSFWPTYFLLPGTKCATELKSGDKWACGSMALFCPIVAGSMGYCNGDVAVFLFIDVPSVAGFIRLIHTHIA